MFIQFSLSKIQLLFDYNQYDYHQLQDIFYDFSSFLVIFSIFEYVMFVYFEWNSDTISFLFTRAIQACILFEARGPTDLSAICVSACKNLNLPRDTFHPTISFLVQIIISVTVFQETRLGERQISSRLCNLLSMQVDSLVDQKEICCYPGLGIDVTYQYIYIYIYIYISS